MSKIAYTHQGRFHADDVLGAALLKIAEPGIKICRVAEVPKDRAEDSIVFDLGGGEFDHHQLEAELRKNGQPYAAFGLLWRKFGPRLVGEAASKQFDRDFIEVLDFTDNTGQFNSLCAAIDSFNPNWDKPEAADNAFDKAVNWAETMLRRLILQLQSKAKAKDVVAAALAASDGKVVVLPQQIPWEEVLCDSTASYVIYPSSRGGYNAKAVPVAANNPKLKRPFPAEWLNNPPEDLRFIHKNRFLISTDRIKTALALCRLALEA